MTDTEQMLVSPVDINRFGRVLKLYRLNAVRPDGSIGYDQQEAARETVQIAKRYPGCLPISNSHLSGVENGINAISHPMLSSLSRLYRLTPVQLYELMEGDTPVEDLELEMLQIKISKKTPRKAVPTLQKVTWWASLGASLAEKYGLTPPDETEVEDYEIDQTEEVMRDIDRLQGDSPEDIRSVLERAVYSSK